MSTVRIKLIAFVFLIQQGHCSSLGLSALKDDKFTPLIPNVERTRLTYLQRNDVTVLKTSKLEQHSLQRDIGATEASYVTRSTGAQKDTDEIPAHGTVNLRVDIAEESAAEIGDGTPQHQLRARAKSDPSAVANPVSGYPLPSTYTYPYPSAPPGVGQPHNPGYPVPDAAQVKPYAPGYPAFDSAQGKPYAPGYTAFDAAQGKPYAPGYTVPNAAQGKPYAPGYPAFDAAQVKPQSPIHDPHGATGSQNDKPHHLPDYQHPPGYQFPTAPYGEPPSYGVSGTSNAKPQFPNHLADYQHPPGYPYPSAPPDRPQSHHYNPYVNSGHPNHKPQPPGHYPYQHQPNPLHSQTNKLMYEGERYLRDVKKKVDRGVAHVKKYPPFYRDGHPNFDNISKLWNDGMRVLGVQRRPESGYYGDFHNQKPRKDHYYNGMPSPNAPHKKKSGWFSGSPKPKDNYYHPDQTSPHSPHKKKAGWFSSSPKPVFR